MAELAEAVAEIARLHDMYREQGLEIDRLAAAQNRPLQEMFKRYLILFLICSPELMTPSVRKIFSRNLFLVRFR